jgi:hypothetical protein
MVTGLRALSIQQPYAWAIATQGKDVENRTRPTAHRGLLAIHASKKPDEYPQLPYRAEHVLRRLLAERALSRRRPEGAELLVGGMIVAVAEVSGCHWWRDCLKLRKRGSCWGEYACSEWAATGQFHWELSAVRPLAEPVPCKGMLGLWTVPDDVESAVRAQLEASADA